MNFWGTPFNPYRVHRWSFPFEQCEASCRQKLWMSLSFIICSTTIMFDFDRHCKTFAMNSHDYLWVSEGTVLRILLCQPPRVHLEMNMLCFVRGLRPFSPSAQPWNSSSSWTLKCHWQAIMGRPCVGGSAYNAIVIPGWFLPWMYQQKIVYYINLLTL